MENPDSSDSTARAALSAGPVPVSVVIPAFNCEKTIVRSISSVRAQSYGSLEIVVVDDCSADGTASAVEAIGDPAIRLVRHQANGGASAARNTGIREATGRYIAFLDADDEWAADKIARQVALFEQNGDLGMVICDGDRIAPDGTTVGTIFSGYDPGIADAWKLLLEQSFIQTSCVMARRDLLVALGGFNTSLVVAEDWDLWLRLVDAAPFGAVPEKLVSFHMTPGSLMSREAGKEPLYLLPMIEKHVEAFKDRLTDAECGRILGHQYQRCGRAACLSGSWVTGATLLLRALFLGREPVMNGLYIVRSGLRRLLGDTARRGPNEIKKPELS
jgi:hypothetical protein